MQFDPTFRDGSKAAHRFRVLALPLARGYVEKGANLTQEESKTLLVEAKVTEQAAKKASTRGKKGKR